MNIIYTLTCSKTEVILLLPLTGFKISEKIYDSKQSLVYRGIREHDKQSMVMKMPNEEYPSANTIAKYKHEYEIIQSLNHDQIIKSWGLEESMNRPVLLLEDIEGYSIRDLLHKQSFDLLTNLQMAIKMTECIATIHQHHIIHKDINPSNFIVNLNTKQVKLIDFGISSRLPRESQGFLKSHALEGTLAYISPEQTGRMNRLIDYRTDFYSLGVTLYELFTGHIPFLFKDPMEIIHAHLAIQPPLPHDLNPDLPTPLAHIIMKCLSKMAEDRYGSARGIIADLTICLHQWQKHGTIENFTLGLQDVSNQFYIPQKLYGRDLEIKTLMTTFDRISQGSAEFILISGYSGIGKTALIHELHKPITQTRGSLITGKCDQYKRDIPYDSMIQAFQELIQQLLTKNKGEIEDWKQKILQAVGSNGQVLIDVIPQLEWIIGKQSTVQLLPPIETQNRFRMVMQNFIYVCAQKDHPLVFFLDDLQWADFASLELLQHFMTNEEAKYILLIGAYRDQEIDSIHPLPFLIDDLLKNKITLQQRHLEPLQVTDIELMLVDTFTWQLDMAPIRELAQVILNKTNGNPFFIRELLTSLYEQQLIEFNHSQNCWQWPLEKIRQLDSMDNVADFMMNKIQKLPQETQHLLSLAASLGNILDLQTLALINESTQQETMRTLWPALKESILHPLGTDYKLFLMNSDSNTNKENTTERTKLKFGHDRLQQAAYSLLADEKQAVVHHHIGRILLSKMDQNELEKNIFDVINHVNAGCDLLNQEETLHASQLNLIAGRKAKSSSAYETALTFFRQGTQLLREDSWQTHYDLTYNLFVERLEVEYLNRHVETAEQLFVMLLENVPSVLDKVHIYDIKIRVHVNQDHHEDAFTLGKEALGLLGASLPSKNFNLAILMEIAKIKWRIGKQTMDDLLDLPEMSDPYKKATMKLYTSLESTVYFIDLKLFILISLKGLNLSLRYGNCVDSPLKYIVYGISLGMIFGQYAAGHKFGQFACQLADKFDDTSAKGSVYFNYCYFHIHWGKNESLEKTDKLKLAYQYATESGDLLYASHCVSWLVCRAIYDGLPLEEVYNYTKIPHINLSEESSIAIKFLRLYYYNLKGLTESRSSYSMSDFDEVAFQNQMNEYPVFRQYSYYAAKMASTYILEEFEIAHELKIEVDKRADVANGLRMETVSTFFQALIMSALYDQGNTKEKKYYKTDMKKRLKLLKRAAEHCPDLFLHQYLLIQAEMSRVSGHDTKAMTLYDQAIQNAHDKAFLPDEAIANECAAKFCLNKGKHKLAEIYIKQAHYTFLKWGATLKVQDLEEKYPHILSRASESQSELLGATSTTFSSSANNLNNGNTLETLNTSPATHNANFSTALNTNMTLSLTSTNATTSFDTLDLSTVLNASQAISGEIVSSKLLKKLMNILLQNAGAEKGILIFIKNGELFIEAHGKVDQSEQISLQSVPVTESDDVPHSIVNYAARTKEDVVLHDAAHEGLFTKDEYVLNNQVKSILCLPIIHQGKLTCILYVENNLSTGTFTPNRVQLLKMLSSQFAISIENAYLYEGLEQSNQTLEQKVQERTFELTKTNQQLKVSEMRYRTIFENTGTAMVMMDENFTMSLANSECVSLFGYTQEELEGKKWTDIIVSNKQRSQNKQHTNHPNSKSMRHSATLSQTYESDIVCKSGETKNVFVTISWIPETNKSVASILDITERKKAEDLIRKMAYHDALTGLPNRKLFEERLAKELQRAEQNNEMLAVMFMDLDGFKLVNDTHGHDVGDQLLCEVAQRLSSLMKENDTASRLGGDEFTILLTSLQHPDDAVTIAQNIHHIFSKPIVIVGKEFYVQTSIGISVYPINGSDSKMLLKAADEAMYQAKNSGRNKYQIYLKMKI